MASIPRYKGRQVAMQQRPRTANRAKATPYVMGAGVAKTMANNVQSVASATKTVANYALWAERQEDKKDRSIARDALNGTRTGITEATSQIYKLNGKEALNATANADQKLSDYYANTTQDMTPRQRKYFDAGWMPMRQGTMTGVRAFQEKEQQKFDYNTKVAEIYTQTNETALTPSNENMTELLDTINYNIPTMNLGQSSDFIKMKKMQASTKSLTDVFNGMNEKAPQMAEAFLDKYGEKYIEAPILKNLRDKNTEAKSKQQLKAVTINIESMANSPKVLAGIQKELDSLLKQKKQIKETREQGKEEVLRSDVAIKTEEDVKTEQQYKYWDKNQTDKMIPDDLVKAIQDTKNLINITKMKQAERSIAGEVPSTADNINLYENGTITKAQYLNNQKVNEGKAISQDYIQSLKLGIEISESSPLDDKILETQANLLQKLDSLHMSKSQKTKYKTQILNLAGGTNKVSSQDKFNNKVIGQAVKNLVKKEGFLAQEYDAWGWGNKITGKSTLSIALLNETVDRLETWAKETDPTIEQLTEQVNKAMLPFKEASYLADWQKSLAESVKATNPTSGLLATALRTATPREKRKVMKLIKSGEKTEKQMLELYNQNNKGSK